MSSLGERLLAAIQRPELALFHVFHKPPYGGSNQFFLALSAELRRRKLRVSANLIGPTTRACLLNSFAFDVARFRRMRRPVCRTVHRVDGPVGTYRGTDHAIDREIFELNQELAHATVFQSRYSLEAHRSLGLQLRDPTVIHNAADGSIFHSRGRIPWDTGRKVRLVTASWSANPNKGAAAYRWLDQHLDWSCYEYAFAGNSPVQFEHIRMLPPLAPASLAELLRQHDVFITASLHEACSNALIEALACGLPAVYARSGGSPELVGEGGLAFDAVEDVPALLAALASAYPSFQAAIRISSLEQTADRYLEVFGLRGAHA